MTNTYRLVLIGFGNVGMGLAQTLATRNEWLISRLNVDLRIVAVVDLLRGSVYDPEGIAPEKLINAVQQGQKLCETAGSQYEGDAQQAIRDIPCDIVVEITPTNLKTGEPSLTHMRLAMESGKHVVTTNKGAVALHFSDLAELADEQMVHMGLEGTVLSGTPAIQLGQEVLLAAGIQRLEGIFNGTCNYILGKMHEGMDYQQALRQAQDLGYAETDPTGDVEGHDVVGKLVILAHLLFDVALSPEEITCDGISSLTPAQILEASKKGDHWKLIGKLELENGRVRGYVEPVALPLSHPLSSIKGATNAITYETDLLGAVTLVGPGAGRMETGFAILSDILAIDRSQRMSQFQGRSISEAEPRTGRAHHWQGRSRRKVR